jgi:pyrimidine operon attenuation protein / uracil phosphoribosyltransferase
MNSSHNNNTPENPSFGGAWGGRTILDKQQLHLTILRLAQQLLENSVDLNDIVFIGIQPRGVQVGTKLMECIQQLSRTIKPQYGILDITFYRDDVRDELHVAGTTDIPFSIEGKKVVLIDDVLYTGRTIPAGFWPAAKSRIMCAG